jgi:lipopolysaccharide heptosyltransferase II
MSERIVTIQTAFIGDCILTLPVLQVLRERLPDAYSAMVVNPIAADALRNHPAIDEVIVFDKKGRDRGIGGLLALIRLLRSSRFTIALIPHRSLRSALLARLAGIPKRIGFSTSAAPRLFTDIVRYEPAIHEVERNLALLGPLSIGSDRVLPVLVPDASGIDAMLNGFPHRNMVALAPGSQWNTKRWPEDHFGTLGRLLAADGHMVVLIGGPGDAELCNRIASVIPPGMVVQSAGRCSLLQSAELIRRSRLLVSNDSAPMHIAVAVGTPVVAIFGATSPSFGFSPIGPRDTVVEREGLSCKPCSIHGGTRCPIGTFECMISLSPSLVAGRARTVLGGSGNRSQSSL